MPTGGRVPSVLGLADADARDTLHNAGLDAHVVVQQEPPAPDSAQRLGVAWKQSPAAGATGTG